MPKNKHLDNNASDQISVKWKMVLMKTYVFCVSGMADTVHIPGRSMFAGNGPWFCEALIPFTWPWLMLGLGFIYCWYITDTILSLVAF